MAEDGTSTAARTLEFTPTWALASVATFFVLISFFVERLLLSLGHYLQRTERKHLLAALQKMKDELMLMGFISLTITIMQGPVSKVCIRSSLYETWTPCKLSLRPNATTPSSNSSSGQKLSTWRPSDIDLTQADGHGRRLLNTESTSTNCKAGYESFVSPNTLHQLHIFIFVLALFHVVYCCLTMILALTKVYFWKKWEKEAHDAACQATTAELIRNITYTRQSTFVRYHTSKPWGRSRFFVWLVCFFQQFYIPRADYLALRLSFITTHNLKDLYDFHAYMVRTMEDEFETIVGISGWLWGYVVLFWIFNIYGTKLYFWTSFIPVVVIFAIGTKLQHVVATLALENSGVRGPLTAFEFATFVWHLWQFGYHTCLLEKNKAYVFGRLIIGLAVLLCSSFSTLPLYALVTQMGTSYKKAVLSKHVERALRQWHKDAKNRLKVSASSAGDSSHDASTLGSNSLILHFRSKYAATSLQRVGNRSTHLGNSARLSLPMDTRMEEGTLYRTRDAQFKSGFPTTAQSIWERRLRTGLSLGRDPVIRSEDQLTPTTIIDERPKVIGMEDQLTSTTMIDIPQVIGTEDQLSPTIIVEPKLHFLTPSPNLHSQSSESGSDADVRPHQLKRSASH